MTKGLGFANWKLGKNPEMFWRRGEVKSFYSKKCILENNQSSILSSRIGPGQLSVRCQVLWRMVPGLITSGGLDNGCEVIWTYKHSLVLQEIIRGFSRSLMYIQSLMQDWKLQKFVSRLVKTRIELSLHASTYLILVI